jgi:PAS domain S-box-containing protein
MDVQSPNRLTYISPSVSRLLGYSVDEATTKTMEEVLTPKSLEVVTKAIAEELTAEKIQQKDLTRSLTLELELNHKNGSLVPVEVKYIFLPGADGRPAEILAVARDLSKRRGAELVYCLANNWTYSGKAGILQL